MSQHAYVMWMQPKAFLALGLALLQCLMPATGVAKAASPKNPPVILVDHILMLDAWVKDYDAIQGAIFKAFGSVPAWQVVDQKDIQTFVNQHVKRKDLKAKDDGALKQAKAFLNKGVQAYHGLQFVSAIQNLTQSRDAWIQNLAHLRSNRDLIKSHLYLAMALLAAQREDADRLNYDKRADVELEKAVLLDASLKLSDRIYNPDVIKRFEQTKQRILQKPRVTLRVSSEVKNARVYINGKLSGRTPLSKQMIPGTYYVLVEPQASEAAPWSSLLELKKPITDINATPTPLLDLGKERNLFRIREAADQQAADTTFIQNRARALNAQFIFLGSLEQSNGYRLLGQLMDVRTKEFSQVAFAHLGNDINILPQSARDLAMTLSEQVRRDGYLVNSQYQDPDKQVAQKQIGENPNAKPSKTKSKKNTFQLHKKWWFWVGLAAIGAGGYVAYDEYGPTPTGKIKVNNKGNF